MTNRKTFQIPPEMSSLRSRLLAGVAADLDRADRGRGPCRPRRAAGRPARAFVGSSGSVSGTTRSSTAPPSRRCRPLDAAPRPASPRAARRRRRARAWPPSTVPRGVDDDQQRRGLARRPPGGRQLGAAACLVLLREHAQRAVAEVSDSAGIASTSSIAAASPRVSAGRRMTAAVQRAQNAARRAASGAGRCASSAPVALTTRPAPRRAAEQRDQRGQQRDRAEHRDRHDDHRADRQRPHHGRVEQEQPGERDQRPSCPRRRRSRRRSASRRRARARGPAGVDLLAVAARAGTASSRPPRRCPSIEVMLVTNTDIVSASERKYMAAPVTITAATPSPAGSSAASSDPNTTSSTIRINGKPGLGLREVLLLELLHAGPQRLLADQVGLDAVGHLPDVQRSSRRSLAASGVVDLPSTASGTPHLLARAAARPAPRPRAELDASTSRRRRRPGRRPPRARSPPLVLQHDPERLGPSPAKRAIWLSTATEPVPGTSKPPPVRFSVCRDANGIDASSSTTQTASTSFRRRRTNPDSRSMALCMAESILDAPGGVEISTGRRTP